MNIMRPYENFNDCAFSLDDRRLNKMILEANQMLSAAVNCAGGDAPYKCGPKFYPDHPCVKWVKHSVHNFLELYTYTFCMINESRYRGFKADNHYKTLEKNYSGLKHLPKIPATNPPVCVYDEYKHLPIHIAYKCHLSKKWHYQDLGKAKWTKRSKPDFYGKYIGE